MGKKNFTGGFDALLGEKEKVEKDFSKSQVTKSKKAVSTVITDTKILEKIRFIAFWKRINIKDVMNLAFEEYINKYESTSGEIFISPEE